MMAEISIVIILPLGFFLPFLLTLQTSLDKQNVCVWFFFVYKATANTF